MSKAKIQKSPLETPLKELFGRWMYAARDDLNKVMTGEGLPLRFTPLLHTTYETFAETGREKVFNFKNDEVPQILAMIMQDFLQTAAVIVKNNPADLTADTLADYIDDIDAANGVSQLIRFAHGRKFGETLDTANDPKGWLTSKFTSELGPLNPNPTIRALLESEFITFIKAAADRVCVMHQGLPHAIDIEMWNAFALGFNIMPIQCVYRYQSSLRVRVIKKKPAKPDVAVVDATKPAEAVVEATKPADAEVAALLNSI
jgi:hypothetical protein